MHSLAFKLRYMYTLCCVSIQSQRYKKVTTQTKKIAHNANKKNSSQRKQKSHNANKKSHNANKKIAHNGSKFATKLTEV